MSFYCHWHTINVTSQQKQPYIVAVLWHFPIIVTQGKNRRPTSNQYRPEGFISDLNELLLRNAYRTSLWPGISSRCSVLVMSCSTAWFEIGFMGDSRKLSNALVFLFSSNASHGLWVHLILTRIIVSSNLHALYEDPLSLRPATETNPALSSCTMTWSHSTGCRPSRAWLYRFYHWFHLQEWSMSNFPCRTRNLTSHSMENLTFHSLTQMKDDYTTNSHYLTNPFLF